MICIRQGAVRFSITGAVLGFCLVTGCGGSKGDLSGTVKHKGSPLKFGQVTFQGADGKIFASEIQPDGTYKVQGLRIGSTKVGVTCTDTEAETKWFRDASAAGKGGGGGPKGTPDQFLIVPRKYGDLSTTELSVDVKGGAQVHNIDVP